MKIGVFAGDLFWSSCPYECLNVFSDVSRQFDTDYIMFERDIRLNKKWHGNEKFQFKTGKFTGCKKLRIISTWDDLYKISKEYKTILTRCKFSPKQRFPHSIRKDLKCPLSVWDVGGLDILVGHSLWADNFLVKGPEWKRYLEKVNSNKDSKSAVSLCPQYDPYYRTDMAYGNPILKDDFFKKYNLDRHKNILLVAPSNPGSHTEMFNQNLDNLEKIVELSHQNNFQVLIKTYPHDYMFYESEGMYTGVYKRKYGNMPQYEFLKNRIPEVIIIESQDHYSAMKHSSKIFNMSGSSISWESFFTNGTSYSMNLKDKKYYKTVSYLPSDITFPDDVFNIDVSSCDQIFDSDKEVEKGRAEMFFTYNNRDNIANKLKDIL